MRSQAVVIAAVGVLALGVGVSVLAKAGIVRAASVTGPNDETARDRRAASRENQRQNLRGQSLETLCAVTGLYDDTLLPNYRIPPEKVALIRGRRELVPALTQIVGCGTDYDSLRAAALLGYIGPTAIDDGLPTLTQALARRSGLGDFVYRQNVAADIVLLCGGPDKTAPFLVTLLKNPAVPVRESAAATLSRLSDFQSHSVERDAFGKYHPPAAAEQLTAGFFEALPALARAADQDSEAAVRQAALSAISAIASTHSENAAPPWVETLGILCRERDPAKTSAEERQGILRLLATAPTQTPESVAVIREAVSDPDDLVHAYALIALNHVLQSDGDAAFTSLIADLSGGDPSRRLKAAREIENGFDALWGYGCAPYTHRGQPHRDAHPKQLPPSVLYPVARHEDLVNRAKAADERRAKLLQALQTGLGDDQPEVRHSCALSIEEAGENIDARLYDGSRPLFDRPDTASIQSALSVAANAMQIQDPSLRARLLELKRKIAASHSVA